MWVADTPTQTMEPPAIYMAAKETVGNQADAAHKVGVCRVVSSPAVEVNPILNAGGYTSWYMHKTMDFARNADNSLRADTVVRIIEEPKHGTLEQKEPEATNFSKYDYLYIPDAAEDYVGNDYFVMEVSAAGITITIYYTMSVDVGQPTYIHNEKNERIPDPTRCPQPNGEFWKISLPTLPTSTSDIQSLLTQTGLSHLPTLAIGNLEGSPHAQTTGQGQSATITLDDNAAGHGWYVDATPQDNAEYLPTSNPNLWLAKEGTEAAGKMDLLSVLLHEYGHALGIEHSAHSGDYMAATLAPGVRRLPSSDELALMAQLAGQARLALGGSDTPAAPNPALPLSALGFALFGRIRRTDYGAWTIEAQNAFLSSTAQHAINPSFSQLAEPSAWQTTGNVEFNRARSVTLGESATTQTQLAQRFQINPGDRTLRFTLSGIDLDDLDNGPDDAFEVALLDANTGVSLKGGTGLSHSDAILNIQADGNEHLANGVSRITNPDGSRTYLVDLTDVPAGTAAFLSFDLIGFGAGYGAQNSHVTLSDIRLGSLPQAQDDTATTREDTPLRIDALANDLDATQPGFTPVIVTGPAHGQAAVNPDSSAVRRRVYRKHRENNGLHVCSWSPNR